MAKILEKICFQFSLFCAGALNVVLEINGSGCKTTSLFFAITQ